MSKLANEIYLILIAILNFICVLSVNTQNLFERNLIIFSLATAVAIINIIEYFYERQ